MKGNYFLGSRQFQVREMSFPPLGDFEVKIQNMAAGICGTDIHIYHGEKGSAEVTPPVVLGHEYAQWKVLHLIHNFPPSYQKNQNHQETALL